MACPKCGNKQTIEEHGLVFFPNMTQAESDKANYKKSFCQICGHEWDKYDRTPKVKRGHSR